LITLDVTVLVYEQDGTELGWAVELQFIYFSRITAMSGRGVIRRTISCTRLEVTDTGLASWLMPSVPYHDLRCLLHIVRQVRYLHRFCTCGVHVTGNADKTTMIDSVLGPCHISRATPWAARTEKIDLQNLDMQASPCAILGHWQAALSFGLALAGTVVGSRSGWEPYP
jgi:hypothetical protein